MRSGRGSAHQPTGTTPGVSLMLLRQRGSGVTTMAESGGAASLEWVGLAEAGDVFIIKTVDDRGGVLLGIPSKAILEPDGVVKSSLPRPLVDIGIRDMGFGSRSSSGYLLYCGDPPGGCGATFRVAGELSEHKRHCPARYRDWGDDSLLGVTVSWETPIQCPLCEERYMAVVGLAFHLREVHKR